MDLEIAKQNILGNNLNPDNQTSIEIPKIINQLDSENIESISLIHNKNHIILAQDIDDNNKSVNQIIEKKAVEFNKSRIRKKLKEIRDKRKIEFNDNDYKIPEEEKQKIKQELLSDNETEKFKESQLESVKIQQENYYEIRQIVNGLNDLNEFSSEIERYNIQRIEEFLPYQELFSQSISNIDLYIKMIETRKKELISFVNEFNDKYILEESKKLDETQILSNLHELYKITRDIDDIDLYEKFNLQSNLDFSNKLSDLMFIRALNNNQNNIINDRYNSQNTGILSGLIKKEVINNKLFGNLLRTSNGKNTYFVSTNKVTCMNTMFINNQTNNKVYSTRTLGELLLEITNPNLKGIDKATRQQIYTTYDGTRPDKESYYKWNGLQVYDIDLKEWKLKDGSHGNVNLLKNKLFELLTEFHWFLWICTSASGNGIHIYTKVSPPHHVYLEAEKNEYISAYWYFVNYITKLSIVYDVLNRLNNIPNNHIEFPNEDFEIKFVDNTVGRITSGIRLTHDENVLVNPNFLDLHPAVMLSQTFDGFNVQEEINKIFLRDSKANNKFIGKINDDLVVGKLEEFEKKKFEKDTPIDLTKFISLGGDISNIIPLNRNQINYVTRYNVCNTLAAMFGKEGLPIAHRLLDSENCRNVGEINSFYSCALTNKKTATKVGIEILKKYGIIKTVETEVKEVLDDKYKAYIKKQIEQALDNHMEDYTFKLNKNQYLGDLNEQLVSMIYSNKINFIFSPAGSGKTQWILKLAREGKKILLVLPFISVIQNKVESDKDLMDIFECYYGTKDIKQIDYGINAVTTFDKFSKANYEKLSKIYDYICIDESHLLFTSSYRIETTSNVVKKLKELFFISSNDPFAAKLCLFTGTETGESYFFGKVANIIRVSKPSLLKEMEFLICNDQLDAVTRLASKADTLLREGYKLLIPTNKGDIYSEKLIGMIQYLYDGKIKYGYYKRSNTEQEICRLINDKNTTGDYNIIFCSNYLSVGVDINDKDQKFASLYLGNFSGYEIEQFNARIRKTGIKSIYCVTTNNSDGTTNDVLLEEPSLVLRITDDEKLFFLDDKEIANAKTEFLVTYDPVLRRIITPGFSLLNGKFAFNLEEYELVSFENKYSECMQHPIKVARELAKYGYKITVSTEFEGLGLSMQEELKKIGIASAKEEKIRKHNILVGTFLELIDNNTYKNQHGLEFSDVIEFIMKHTDMIQEERDLVDDKGIPCNLKIDFDIFSTPTAIFVRSKEALEKMIGYARYLIKRYSKTKAKELLLRYVTEEGILEQKKFKRAINLLKLVEASDANELSEPITRTLEKIYEFVDKFDISKDYRVTFDSYRSFLELLTNDYIAMLGIKINTKHAFDKIQDSIVEMIQDVATKSTSSKGIRFTYNRLSDQDSERVINRRSVDTIVQNMFKLTSDLILEKNRIRKKHIILQKQEF